MKATPTIVDRLAAWVSPSWGLRRFADRARLEAAKAYYDGADRGRRGNSIRRSAGDANTVTYRDLPSLRFGARDLLRNNPHARRGVEAIVSNTVGTGIAPQFMRGNERAEDLEGLADEHLETTECDSEGRNTYAGLQALALETIASSGEVLIRRRYRRSRDPIAVPLQFQVIEPDYLDESKDGPTDRGGEIVQGVEYDAIGRIRGYWLYKNHPGGRAITLRSDFVPARDVAHVFRTDRPGQARGIPWLAPVMLRLQDFADYEEAQLVRQKIAACFAGFIEESFDYQLGAPPGAEKDDDGNIVDTIEPGIIERLPFGTQIKFSNPPDVEGYNEYSGVSLRAIAAGLGISYEAMTGDLRGVNFSSGKMGRLEFERNIDRWRNLMLIPQLCAKLMSWWLEAAALKGLPINDVSVKHIPPRREMIDPSKEGQADIKAIRAGLKTLTQAIRERGRDPKEHLEELAADRDLIEELGLTLDSVLAPGEEPDDGDDDGEEDMDALVDALRERGILKEFAEALHEFSGNGATA